MHFFIRTQSECSHLKRSVWGSSENEQKKIHIHTKIVSYTLEYCTEMKKVSPICNIE